MDSDSEIAMDFNELVALGRNRTRRRQSLEHNPHYVAMDAPPFIDADGAPLQDEEWWASSFIESDEDSSPTVQTSPEVCTLPSSQVVPSEAASFHQGNVTSAESDSSSSSSSTIDFISASAALPLLPDNVASTDSDSSTSSTSTINFVTASSALPLVPDDSDLACIPPASPNQLMSIAVQPFEDGSDQMMLLTPEPDSDNSVQQYGDGSDQMLSLSPEADLDDSDDSDFAPSPPASSNESLNISDGPLSIYSDYASSPSVSFLQSASTADDSGFAPLPPASPNQSLSISDGSDFVPWSPDSPNQSLSISAGPISAYSDYVTSPSVLFNQSASTTDYGDLTSLHPTSPNHLLSISDGSLSTYSDYTTAPSVSFNQDDSYFASGPPVSPNQSLNISDGSLSTYSDYATAPSVSFNQGVPTADDGDLTSIPPASPNQSLTISDGGCKADFTPLPMADLSFSPPSTAEKQRNLIMRRNPRQRARRARRALNFASPIVNRASNILPAVQATELSGQLPSVCADPADDDFAPSPCVDFNLSHDPDGGTSSCTEFIPLPYSSFNHGVPTFPLAADATALSITDFAALLNVIRNYGGPMSLSVAVPNQRSAVSRKHSLPKRPRRYRRASNFFSLAAISDQQPASEVALPAVSLQPSRSASPPGAIPKRRSAVLRSCTVSYAPLPQRPRRGQHALNFAPLPSRVPAIKPSDEIFPVERRGVAQAAISRNQQSDEEKSHLVIGEIAFQLDRRILSYIFVGQPHLYGFRVGDINERIKQVARSDLQRDEMLARNTEIMNTLSNYGYCPVIHSIFSEFIVNTFGIFKEKPSQEMLENYNNQDYLYKLIAELTPPTLLHNMLVLLNSLWHLSVADGRPIFIW